MTDPIVQRRVDGAQSLNYNCQPDPDHHMTCACGYSGRPEFVIPYSRMPESDAEFDMFVCPECGDA